MIKIILAGLNNVDDNMLMEEIGQGYIASFLRSKGYQVLITGGLEKELDYHAIEQFAPHIIGVTLYQKNKNVTYRFIEKIKALFPEAHVVAGGYLATYFDEEVLSENKLIDTIIRGEGEYSFFDLVQYVEGKKSLAEVRSLSYIQGGRLIRNEMADLISNLSEMPFPARDYLMANQLKVALVCTSRGCVANCNFCIARSYWKKWRGRNVQSIVEEIRQLNDIGVTSINFIDTSFEDPDNNCQRMYEIARGIVESAINIKYYIDIRAEFYKKSNDELIKMLIKSGLTMVLIGIEAGNLDDMLLYGKLARLEDNKKCIDYLKSKNILTNIGFINLNPYSNVNTIRQNIDFLFSIDFTHDMQKFLSRYQLSKGSKLYEMIKDDHLLLDGQYDDFYNYKFVNNYVQDIYNFVAAKVAENSETYYLFTMITYYFMMLKGMELLFLRDENMSDSDISRACKYIMENFETVQNELKNVGQINKIYLHKLVDLCESGWNYKTAESISSKYMGIDEIENIRAKIALVNLKFYKKLIKEFYFKRDEIDIIYQAGQTVYP